MISFRLLSAFVLAIVTSCAVAQGKPNLTCSIAHPSAPTPAYEAFEAHDLSKAESLYRAEFDHTKSVESSSFLVRTLLAEAKLAEALKVAQQTVQNAPQNAIAVASLGEARFRRGEVDQAAPLFVQATKLDPCYGRGHYDISRYMRVIGLFASADRQLQIAHQLSPYDPAITGESERENPARIPIARRIAQIKTELAGKDLASSEKKDLDHNLRELELEQSGSCTLTENLQQATLPLVQFQFESHSLEAIGMDLQLNGHKTRLQLDTGASGIYISQKLADSIGLKAKLDSLVGGISGTVSKTTIAVVDHLHIGNFDFQNCPVTIGSSIHPASEYGSVVNFEENISDGLIGADIFDKYLVKIDIPNRKMTLSPLPPRPGTVEPSVGGLHQSAASSTPTDVEPAAEDRYIAPEMKNWTSILRVGHELIVPTQLNGGPVKLMILDTGASRSTISATAASEVTKVSSSSEEMYGVSGKVAKTFQASRVNLSFGGVQQSVDQMAAIDTTGISRSSGMEVAGLIGYTVLRELSISIDYRDNLIQVIYDPNHGIHPGLKASGKFN